MGHSHVDGDDRKVRTTDPTSLGLQPIAPLGRSGRVATEGRYRTAPLRLRESGCGEVDRGGEEVPLATWDCR